MSKVEYIEREKLIRYLEEEIDGCKRPVGSRANGKGIAYGTMLGLKMAKSFAETLPAADVVPKGECDKWYGEYHRVKDDLAQEKMYHRETEKLADKYFVELQTAKTAVAKEIFSWIEENAVNLDFITGNFQFSLERYLDFKERFLGVKNDG